MPTTVASNRRSLRGFSLVELLVVIAIIALLISILLPALAGARTAAKVTSTDALLNDFMQASQRYQLDNGGEAPGYFTPEQLGSVDNETAGLTGNENALLSLIGGDGVLGIVEDTDLADFGLTAADVIEVGYGSADDQKVYVDPSLIGTGDTYWEVEPKFLASLTADPGGEEFQSSMGNDNAADSGNTDIAFSGGMPEVIDAFGQPLLVWTQSAFGGRDLQTRTSYDDWRDQFVQADDQGSVQPMFYLNQNKGYLGAMALGGKTDDPTMNSAIGYESSGFSDDARDTFMAIFGNPAYPAVAATDEDDRVFNPGNLSFPGDAETIVPLRPRGKFMVHSAGKDGMWLSKTGKGFRATAFDPDRSVYGVTFANRINGTSDEASDLLDAYDDQVVSTD